MKDISTGDVPLGLGMALAQDPDAMRAFGALSDGERQLLLQRAHSVHSKAEMSALVRSLSTGRQ